jgi:hypothetical protein
MIQQYYGSIPPANFFITFWKSLNQLKDLFWYYWHWYILVTRAPIRIKLLLEASHFLGVHQFPISMKVGQINMKSWTLSFLSWGLDSYCSKLGEKFSGLICTNVRKKLIKLQLMSSTIITTNWFNLGRGRETNNLKERLIRLIFRRYIDLEYP